MAQFTLRLRVYDSVGLQQLVSPFRSFFTVRLLFGNRAWQFPRSVVPCGHAAAEFHNDLDPQCCVAPRFEAHCQAGELLDGLCLARPG